MTPQEHRAEAERLLSKVDVKGLVTDTDYLLVAVAHAVLATIPTKPVALCPSPKIYGRACELPAGHDGPHRCEKGPDGDQFEWTSAYIDELITTKLPPAHETIWDQDPPY